VSDKNLLERLGIITNQNDEENEATTTTATVTPISANVEVAKEVSPSLSELTFVDEKTNNNNYAISVNKKSAVKVVKPIEKKEEPIVSEEIEAPAPPVETTPEPSFVNVTPINDSFNEEESDKTSENDQLLSEIIDSHSHEDEIEDTKSTYEPETLEPEGIDFEMPKFETYEPEPVAYKEPSPINYDKYVSIADLYRMYDQKSSGIDTIFIVDAFSKSLPDNLSKNIKRQSVLNIIDASKIDLNGLVNDGLERIDNINAYLKEFTQHTDSILSQKEAQVEELEEQIKLLKKEIKERNRLQEKQENAIELESHKIRTTLEFVSHSDNNAEE